MKIDGLISESIYDLIEKMNYLKLKKEDIISVFQDNKGQYIVIYLEK